MTDNIVLFDTGIGSGNIGDDIIMDSAIRNMRDVFDSKGMVARLGTHISNFTYFQMRKPNEKIEWYCNAPYKFILGTNLLINFKNSRQRQRQWQLFPFNKRLFQNSVLVGAGTKIRKKGLNEYTTRLYKEVLSDRYFHSVRDEQSKLLLEGIGIRAEVTGCPSLWEMTEERCKAIPVDKADAVITSVSGNKKYQAPELDQKMLEILCRNYKKVFVWIQTNADEPYFDSLLENAQLPEIQKIFTLHQYTELLEKGGVDYIGTRLHGGVHALTTGARTLVVSIDERAKGFSHEHNLPIIFRNSIPDDLENMINHPLHTEIKNNWELIREFKGQFL